MLRIKSMRTERNISQRALAQKIGCSQKSIDYWEKGLSEPTERFIISLADYFGCSTDYLLGREDDYGNVNINSDLGENEKSLLSVYRSLPESKKSELMLFAEFISKRK